MPGMDGFETCRRLKADERTRPIPVVMVTAVRTEVSSQIKCLEIGADAYLSKPIDAQELVSQLKVALRMKSAEDALRAERGSLETLVQERTAELRKSHEQFRIAQDMSPDGFTILQPVRDARDRVVDFIWVYENSAIARLNGTDPEKVVGRRLLELFPGHRGTSLLQAYQQVAESEEPQTFEAEYSGESMVNPTCFRIVVVPMAGDIAILAQDITARKQAEDAVRKQEAMYFKMLASIGDVIVIIDEEGINRYKSPNIEKLFGWKPEEVVGKSTWDNVHPDDIKSTQKFFEEMMHAPDAVKTMECRYRCKDGTYKWIEFTGNNLLDDPDLHGILGNYKDITERKEAEDLLLEKTDLLQNVTDNMFDLVAITDLSGVFTYAGPSHRILGFEPEEFLGSSVFDYVHPDDAGYIAKEFAELTANPTPEATKTVEYRQRCADGKYKWLETKGKFLFADEQFAYALFFSSRDITERKRAEEALRESERFLRSSLDGLSDHIAVVDDRGQIVLTNKAYRDFAERNGVNPGDVSEGINYLAACDTASGEHSQEAGPFADGIRDVVSGKRRYFELEYPCHSQDEKRWFIGRVTPFTGKGPRRVVVAHQNITERKQAEAEREKLRTQLIQAQKMESVGRLAGGVAHDFNNMLGVILGHTELAMDKLDPSQPLYTHLLEVRKAAERSADLTRQLLAFARKQTIAPKVLDLNDTVESMLKMLRRLIGEDIHLAWMPGANLFPVKVDPSQIDQILANLCVNARDAIKGVGKITIETQDITFDEAYCDVHTDFIPGEYVLLAVSDDGCGMDKETQSHLFEPFFTTKGMGQGTGLGLATVYGIVRQNNGFINVYSEPGQGTTIKVYLPQYETGTPAQTDTATVKPVACGNETILLVEDEPTLLRLATIMLERLGYVVIVAKTPGEAIHLAHEHSGPIHLLMTDVVMPGMNGRDLAKNLLSIYPGIKSLFMSGYTANVIAHNGVLDEGVHFIQKPFSLKDLGAKLRDVLED
jgi:PAS domain S-box-containing protein